MGMKSILSVLIMLFLLLQYRLWLGTGGLIRLWQINQSVEEQRQQNNRLEERNLALESAVWDGELCSHCGKWPLVCPHGVIRSKVFDPALTDSAPPSFKHVPVRGKELSEGWHISYQVAPEDCTGCGTDCGPLLGVLLLRRGGTAGGKQDRGNKCVSFHDHLRYFNRV